MKAEHSAARISARTALIMVLFTLAFTTLMAGVYVSTKGTIAASDAEEKLRLIGEVLPPSAYDNALLQDSLEIPATPLLGLDHPSRVYRARKAGRPVALVIEAAAPDGYSGKIELILAVRVDAVDGQAPTESPRIAAVRVTQHRETPGLGDYIDPKKDKNKQQPWIAQFAGRGPAENWQVKKDGGPFAQRAGATISARAVTHAVGRALKFAADNQQRLFAAP